MSGHRVTHAVEQLVTAATEGSFLLRHVSHTSYATASYDPAKLAFMLEASGNFKLMKALGVT